MHHRARWFASLKLMSFVVAAQWFWIGNAWLLLSFKHVFFTATGNYQCSCWILRCSVHIIQCRGLRFRSHKSYVSPGDLIQYTVQGQKDTMKISMSYHNLYHKQYHHSSYLRNSNCGENYDRDEPT